MDKDPKIHKECYLNVIKILYSEFEPSWFSIHED